MAGEDAFQNKKCSWIHQQFEHDIIYCILNWVQCILAFIICSRALL